MHIVYHCLSQVIDFLFPKDVGVYDVSAFPENKEYLGAHITALFSYQDQHVKEAVWQIKYYRNEKVAEDIAKALYEKILSLNLPVPFFVLPIPMSDSTKKLRGYNQTEFIAEKLVMLLGNEICCGISKELVKHNHLIAQHTLEKAARVENAKGMFYVRTKNCFEHKNILIIDDVITTGSTIKEAMQIAYEQSSQYVHALGIAH